ncbi:MAG TPA: hypothetical protein PLM00_07475 [Spirochaetota bacterium]|nr:hypothetical protein [Spirochaetota bacterium]HPN83217.1 hypothetical protein [Spirochaetota bacterium]
MTRSDGQWRFRSELSTLVRNENSYPSRTHLPVLACESILFSIVSVIQYIRLP